MAVAYATVCLPIGFTTSITTTKKFRIGAIRGKFKENEDHPLLRAAINRAAFRFQETIRPDPLFIDQYAGSLLPNDYELDEGHSHQHYCIATRFIDDKLLETVKRMDGLNQVVLLTDGMDTRPYRLNWPNSMVIFGVSPEFVSRTAGQKFEDYRMTYIEKYCGQKKIKPLSEWGEISHPNPAGRDSLLDVGAKVRKGCLFRHVPFEAGDLPQTLRNKGFKADQPSIWALQGLPLETTASFEAVLSAVGSLAMKGCVFLGELPALWAETKPDNLRMMDKVFMSHGFRVVIISHEEVATNLHRELALGDSESILFVAEQLRFSDNQIETWRSEFHRMEEEADEDGFEEL